jgi:hypothetical protein
VIFLLNIVVYLCIGLLPSVYSDDIDEIIVSDTSSSTSTSSGSGSGGGISSSTSSGTGSGNLSNATDKVDLGGGDGSNFIPSLLDGDLSPLEVILNCEILINIMILVHIIILVLVLIEKFNVKIIKNSSVGFISKYLNKYKLNKVENIINKLGELTNKYLSLLIIINVIIIIFYICLNVYVNIELSNNLNEYISIYNKFHIKEGGILFLLLNCKIKCKYVNRLEKRLFSSSNIRNKGIRLRSLQTTKNYCNMFKNKIKNYCCMFTDKLNWVRLMDNVKLN